MFYNNLIINNNFINLTKNYLKNNRVPHALLLYGDNGSGKEGHAIELAATLNCKLNENYEACGNCHSCIQLKSMQHPNIYFIIPYPKRNSISKNDPPEQTLNNKDIDELITIKKNKILDPYSNFKLNNANTILINSIRFLKKELYNTSIENGWKIILIFEAEKLCKPNYEAANSLLKILEEPPMNTIFILVTNDYKNIIGTIKSRCQNIYFPRLTYQQFKTYLNNEKIDNQTLKLFIKIFKSNYSLIKNNLSSINDINSKIIEILKTIFYFKKASSIILNLDKSNWNDHLKLFIIIFRDLLLLSKKCTPENLILNNYLIKYQKIINKYPNANFSHCIEVIEKTNIFIDQNGYFPLLMVSLNIEIRRSLNNQKIHTFLI